MKSFLLRNKKPIIKWGMLPDNTFFEGKLPEGYSLAVSPSGNYIVIDVDMHGDINGYENLPKHLFEELENTLTYKTKGGGQHFWFKYTGDKILANKASGLGIDLRTNKGYVVWYHENDIRDVIDLIKDTSEEMNKWLETLFSYN